MKSQPEESKFNNKVYYGEYSLKHWIKLMMSNNIKIPPYQRFFVWDESKANKLIKSFESKEFIPPVTIGKFEEDGSKENWILDGQQRLTSILLSYLGLFPNPKEFKKIMEEKYADEAEPEVDESDEDALNDILQWQYNQLMEYGNTKADIKRYFDRRKYKEIDFEINEDFLNNNYLGFSYLVPDADEDSTNQQKFYSSVFRHINIQGVPLLPQESRQALYYLNKNYSEYFDPKFINKIKIKSANGEFKIDFVRYLAIVSQYCKSGNDYNSVMKGYAKRFEEYYEEFITCIVGDFYDENSKFLSIDQAGTDGDIYPDLKRFKDQLEALNIGGHFESIIDVDLYLFGLVYWVLYYGYKIDLDRSGELISEINECILSLKSDSLHKRNPSALKYLRMRLRESIDIYQRYIVD